MNQDVRSNLGKFYLKVLIYEKEVIHIIRIAYRHGYPRHSFCIASQDI